MQHLVMLNAQITSTVGDPSKLLYFYQVSANRMQNKEIMRKDRKLCLLHV